MLNRKIKKLILAVLVITLSLTFVNANTYFDSEGHWAEKSIKRWSSLNIIQGYQGYFRPNAPLTRAEMAAIIDRIMVLKETKKNIFRDIKKDDWFHDSVNKLANIGILKGDGKNAMPYDMITREQAVVLLSRLVNLDTKNHKNIFNDENKISPWARKEVLSMAKENYALADDNGNFRPKSYITRAELVDILDRIIVGYFNEAGVYSGIIDGISVVTNKDVKFDNLDVKGKLIISPAIEDYLDDILKKIRYLSLLILGQKDEQVYIATDFKTPAGFLKKEDKRKNTIYIPDYNRSDEDIDYEYVVIDPIKPDSEIDDENTEEIDDAKDEIEEENKDDFEPAKPIKPINPPKPPKPIKPIEPVEPVKPVEPKEAKIKSLKLNATNEKLLDFEARGDEIVAKYELVVENLDLSKLVYQIKGKNSDKFKLTKDGIAISDEFLELGKYEISLLVKYNDIELESNKISFLVEKSEELDDFNIKSLKLNLINNEISEIKANKYQEIASFDLELENLEKEDIKFEILSEDKDKFEVKDDKVIIKANKLAPKNYKLKLKATFDDISLESNEISFKVTKEEKIKSFEIVQKKSTFKQKELKKNSEIASVKIEAPEVYKELINLQVLKNKDSLLKIDKEKILLAKDSIKIGDYSFEIKARFGSIEIGKKSLNFKVIKDKKDEIKITAIEIKQAKSEFKIDEIKKDLVISEFKVKKNTTENIKIDYSLVTDKDGVFYIKENKVLLKDDLLDSGEYSYEIHAKYKDNILKSKKHTIKILEEKIEIQKIELSPSQKDYYNTSMKKGLEIAKIIFSLSKESFDIPKFSLVSKDKENFKIEEDKIVLAKDKLDIGKHLIKVIGVLGTSKKESNELEIEVKKLKEDIKLIKAVNLVQETDFIIEKDAKKGLSISKIKLDLQNIKENEINLKIKGKSADSFYIDKDEIKIKAEKLAVGEYNLSVIASYKKLSKASNEITLIVDRELEPLEPEEPGKPVEKLKKIELIKENIKINDKDKKDSKVASIKLEADEKIKNLVTLKLAGKDAKLFKIKGNEVFISGENKTAGNYEFSVLASYKEENKLSNTVSINVEKFISLNSIKLISLKSKIKKSEFKKGLEIAKFVLDAKGIDKKDIIITLKGNTKEHFNLKGDKILVAKENLNTGKYSLSLNAKYKDLSLASNDIQIEIIEDKEIKSIIIKETIKEILEDKIEANQEIASFKLDFKNIKEEDIKLELTGRDSSKFKIKKNKILAKEKLKPATYKYGIRASYVNLSKESAIKNLVVKELKEIEEIELKLLSSKLKESETKKAKKIASISYKLRNIKEENIRLRLLGANAKSFEIKNKEVFIKDTKLKPGSYSFLVAAVSEKDKVNKNSNIVSLEIIKDKIIKSVSIDKKISELYEKKAVKNLKIAEIKLDLQGIEEKDITLSLDGKDKQNFAIKGKSIFIKQDKLKAGLYEINVIAKYQDLSKDSENFKVEILKDKSIDEFSIKQIHSSLYKSEAKKGIEIAKLNYETTGLDLSDASFEILGKDKDKFIVDANAIKLKEELKEAREYEFSVKIKIENLEKTSKKISLSVKEDISIEKIEIKAETTDISKSKITKNLKIASYDIQVRGFRNTKLSVRLTGDEKGNFKIVDNNILLANENIKTGEYKIAINAKYKNLEKTSQDLIIRIVEDRRIKSVKAEILNQKTIEVYVRAGEYIASIEIDSENIDKDDIKLSIEGKDKDRFVLGRFSEVRVGSRDLKKGTYEFSIKATYKDQVVESKVYKQVVEADPQFKNFKVNILNRNFFLTNSKKGMKVGEIYGERVGLKESDLKISIEGKDKDFLKVEGRDIVLAKDISEPRSLEFKVVVRFSAFISQTKTATIYFKYEPKIQNIELKDYVTGVLNTELEKEMVLGIASAEVLNLSKEEIEKNLKFEVSGTDILDFKGNKLVLKDDKAKVGKYRFEIYAVVPGVRAKSKRIEFFVHDKNSFPHFTVGEKYIAGEVDKEIGNNLIRVELINDALNRDLKEDEDLKSWFKNLPDGLKAVSNLGYKKGDKALNIRISGIPKKEFDGKLEILPDNSYLIANHKHVVNNKSVTIEIKDEFPTLNIKPRELVLRKKRFDYAKFKIDLEDNRLSRNINRGSDISHWFTNLPKGIKARLARKAYKDSSELVIRLIGRSNKEERLKLKFLVPKKYIKKAKSSLLYQGDRLNLSIR